MLHEGRQAFLAVLDHYTLADLVKRQTELRTLLAIPAQVRVHPKPDAVPL